MKDFFLVFRVYWSRDLEKKVNFITLVAINSCFESDKYSLKRSVDDVTWFSSDDHKMLFIRKLSEFYNIGRRFFELWQLTSDFNLCGWSLHSEEDRAFKLALTPP